MERLIIDATNLILGRMGTFAAKRALLGDNIEIVNCEGGIIRGNSERILKDYMQKFSRGTYAKGPFFYKKPDMFVKRTIRGMLDYKKGRGKEAFNRIKCHIGVPESLSNQNIKTLNDINVLNSMSERSSEYIKIGELCKLLGWKQKVKSR